MNRNEAIEQAANNVLADMDEFAHVDYDNGYIQALREALAMPKADAERVGLLERIDNHMEDNSDLFDLLRDIRAYLGGDA